MTKPSNARDDLMNIHEYQAKALLKSYGAPVSEGRAVLKAE
ncbi:MAG: succinyl-CoA synthetase beta subunit, partial [Gammaproteobacteria bacterium]